MRGVVREIARKTPSQVKHQVMIDARPLAAPLAEYGARRKL